MKIKRILATLISFTLLFCFVGCNDDGNHDDKFLEQFTKVTDKNTASWEQNNEKYDLKWFVDASWMTWPTNGADLVSNVIYQKTGCKIKFQIAGDDSGTELSTLVSSGNLPDVVTVKSASTYAAQLPQQDYVWSLNKLMEYFAPSMTDRYMKEQVDVFNWYKINEQLYGIPNLCYSDYYIGDSKLSPNGAILVREDWYKEVVDTLHIDMTTKASFLSGVEYITNKYSNAIGVQLDPFTTTGNLSVIWLSQFFAVPYENSNGEYVYQITSEKYKEVISFLNTLYTEGYINEANFTANTSAVSTNIARGNVFVSMVTPQNYNNSFSSLHANKTQANPNGVNYIPLILHNDAGDAPILQDLRGKGYMLSFITKDCKRPDKVIQLFDFLSSEEGQLLINFGVEGDTFNWDKDHKKVVWTEKYVNDYEDNNTAQYGFGYCNVLLNQSYYDKVAPTGKDCKTEAYMYTSDLKAPLSPYSYDYTASYLMPDTTRSDYFDYIEKSDRINQLWGRYLPQIIRQESNSKAIDKLNETYKYMKNNGLEFVVSFMSDSYQRAKQILGITYGWPANNPNYESPVTGANGDYSYYLYKS